MNLRCWWFGCDEWHDDRPLDYAECWRCGNHMTYDDLVADSRHQRMMDRLDDIWRIFWPRKCVDCGRRFRKCDETIDHIPF